MKKLPFFQVDKEEVANIIAKALQQKNADPNSVGLPPNSVGLPPNNNVGGGLPPNMRPISISENIPLPPRTSANTSVDADNNGQPKVPLFVIKMT